MAHSRTPDFDRLDDMDIYVQSTPWTPKERAAFSAFLKKEREKLSRGGKTGSIPSSQKRTKVPEK